MIEKWKALYDGLCQDLDRLRLAGLSGTVQTESLFRCCLNYWKQCKTMVQAEGFSDDAAEISFFKHVKPFFTGQLEYHTLIYQYQLFCPPVGVEEIAAFTQNELRKIDRFSAVHFPLLHAYTQGRTDEDSDLFLRRTRPGDSIIPYARPYDMDPTWLTAADWILTQHIGNELYERFLRSG